MSSLSVASALLVGAIWSSAAAQEPVELRAGAAPVELRLDAAGEAGPPQGRLRYAAVRAARICVRAEGRGLRLHLEAADASGATLAASSEELDGERVALELAVAKGDALDVRIDCAEGAGLARVALGALRLGGPDAELEEVARALGSVDELFTAGELAKSEEALERATIALTARLDAGAEPTFELVDALEAAVAAARRTGAVGAFCQAAWCLLPPLEDFRGVDSDVVRELRRSLHLRLRSAGFVAEAVPVAEAVVASAARRFGADSAEHVEARKDLAKTLYSAGRKEESGALFDELLERALRELPPTSYEVQELRSNAGALAEQLGDLERARALLEEALAVLEEHHPKAIRAIASARQNLANTLLDLGELERAVPMLEALLPAALEAHGAGSREAARIFNNLSRAYAKAGDAPRAIALRREVLRGLVADFGEDSLEVAQARMNLADQLRGAGELVAARDEAARSFGKLLEALGPDAREVQRARVIYGTVLDALADHERARSLAEQALAGLEAGSAEGDLLLQQARSLLGNVLQHQGDVEGALALQRGVVRSCEAAFGPDSPDTMYARRSLADALLELGRLDEAEELYEGCLAWVREHRAGLGEHHPDLRGLRSQLSMLRLERGDPAGARALAEQVVADAEALLDTASPTFAWAWQMRLWTSCRLRDVEAARAAARGLAGAVAESLRASLEVGTPREVAAVCGDLGARVETLLSAAWEDAPEELGAELDALALGCSEALRGATVRANELQRAAGNPRVGAARRRVSERRAEVDALAAARAGAVELEPALLARDAAERELARVLADAGYAAVVEGTTAAALAARLREGEASVSFLRYGRAAGDAESARASIEDRLVAFVLRGGGGLARVELGPTERIAAATTRWREAVEAQAPSASRDVVPFGAVARRTDEEVPAGLELYALLLAPLEDALHGARRVHVTLDGPALRVPLDALPVDAGGGRFGDATRVATHVSLRELLEPPAPSASGEARLLALGGLDYGAPGPPAEASARSGSAPALFPALASAEAEARGVAALFEAAGMGEALVLAGDEADERAFARLAPTARWLHLATHGFLLADRPETELASLRERLAFRAGGAEVAGLSPLRGCGLALSGANARGDGGELLTAEELSRLDLTGCELAVLSACDTSLGEVLAGRQGVASLQRALQMAGARSAITSLWKVPDAATRELMRELYRGVWERGERKADALWNAKRALREAVDERGRPAYSTHAWAAWVLTGETD